MHSTFSGTQVVKVDEFPRHNTTYEKLQKLRPAFIQESGSVTAGNASGTTSFLGLCRSPLVITYMQKNLVLVQ